MPYGIDYKRIKKDLAFVSSQARKGCSFFLMYLFGVFFYFEYCLALGVWSLEFIWELKVAAFGRLI
jgi:hypothetical protein